MRQKLPKLLAFAVVGVSALPVIANAADQSYNQMPAGIYDVDKTHASVVWKVNHLGLSDYVARFTSVDATLDFNPTSPEKSTISVRIDPTSLKTDYPYPEEENFDEVLSKGEGWFNSVKFPQIAFESRSIEKTSDNEGIMTGDLTFLGVTKPVRLNVVFNGAFLKKPFTGVPALGFSATGTIKRSDFGMDTYVPNIGDDVKIEIEAEFVKSEA